MAITAPNEPASRSATAKNTANDRPPAITAASLDTASVLRVGIAPAVWFSTQDARQFQSDGRSAGAAAIQRLKPMANLAIGGFSSR